MSKRDLLKATRIPVFTDDPGWHGKRLSHAFAARGMEAVFISLRECSLELLSGSAGITIPGFAEGLPPGVFVRGVPGGTLQQVIARLDVLHALKMSGILVYNDGRAIERTVDKAMTSWLLHRAGIPTPPTWVCESRQHAMQVFQREAMVGNSLVMKPLFGSQGVGVRRLQAGDSLPVPMEQHVDGVYYFQRYVDSGKGPWQDYRVFIIDNVVVAAMARQGRSWINNVAMGASCRTVPVDDDVAEIALEAAKVLDMDYCGVDVIRDKDGKPFVLEVNSIPAWRGLQSVAKIDIAQNLVDDFCGKLARSAQVKGLLHQVVS